MTTPDPAAARRLDAVAVASALRRMGGAAEPPWLHAEVARRMAERLAIIRLKPERVLDWWGWLGAGGPLLDAAYPRAHRIVVEPSPRLLERSRAASAKPWWSVERWSGATIEVIAERAEATDPSAAVQLVWSNMMLHLTVDPPALLGRWQQRLAVDGFVMFSCLGPGTLRELRALYQRLGWPAPTPGYVDMHDLGDMLVAAGFADPVMDQETLQLRWPGPEALLAELRSLGGNTAPDRIAGLRTPRWHARLLGELEALRGADGKLGCSIEVAYGHAFKAGPRPVPVRATAVSLEEMRAMVRSPAARRRSVR